MSVVRAGECFPCPEVPRALLLVLPPSPGDHAPSDLSQEPRGWTATAHSLSGRLRRASLGRASSFSGPRCGRAALHLPISSSRIRPCRCHLQECVSKAPLEGRQCEGLGLPTSLTVMESPPGRPYLQSTWAARLASALCPSPCAHPCVLSLSNECIHLVFTTNILGSGLQHRNSVGTCLRPWHPSPNP